MSMPLVTKPSKWRQFAIPFISPAAPRSAQLGYGLPWDPLVIHHRWVTWRNKSIHNMQQRQLRLLQRMGSGSSVVLVLDSNGLLRFIVMQISAWMHGSTCRRLSQFFINLGKKFVIAWETCGDGSCPIAYSATSIGSAHVAKASSPVPIHFSVTQRNWISGKRFTSFISCLILRYWLTFARRRFSLSARSLSTDFAIPQSAPVISPKKRERSRASAATVSQINWASDAGLSSISSQDSSLQARVRSTRTQSGGGCTFEDAHSR